MVGMGFLPWQNDKNVEEIGNDKNKWEAKYANHNVAEHDVPVGKVVDSSFAVERLVGFVQVNVAFNWEDPHVSYNFNNK